MTRIVKAGLTGLLFLGLVSCADKTPTSADAALITAQPATVELRIPWTQFGSNFAVNGGYGYAYELGTATVANDFDGLTAKTIAEFSGFATDALVRDSIGTLLTDTAVVVAGGYVTATFDTLTSTVSGPLTLDLGSLSQSWDPLSVTWDMRVDTTNDHEAWSSPGGGTIVPLADTTWTPGSGDSIVFRIDSSVVAGLADTTLLTHGIVITGVNPDTRIHITSLNGRLNAKSKIAPDTTVNLPSALAHMTFIYSPAAPPPSGNVRVGGVPAWRTVMTLTVPDTIDSLPAVCAVVSCPVALKPGNIDYAALILHTDTGTLAFQPTDTMGVDVRAVLDPSQGAKSPLGSSFFAADSSGMTGVRIPPSAFRKVGGQDVEIPITGFVQQMLAGDTTSVGLPVPHTLALVASGEPSTIQYASFVGPGGGQYAPVLKLIITVSKTVELP